jgi:hypothetical protein
VATAPGRVEIDYPHRRAGHCGSGSFRDLLEFHGLSWFDGPMSEGMAFGLGAGLGFSYVEIPGMTPPLYMVGRGAAMERDFCEHLGIGVDNRHTDDPAEGWALVRDRLDAGEPAMVNADIAHLEYLRVRLQMTMHVIVITGYDEAEGVAFIADNDRDEIQRCSLTALAAARHSDGFPAPNRHSTWLMDFPAALPEPGPVVTRAVVRAVEHMRGAMSDSLGAPPEAMGIAGVGTFAGGYASWPERFGDGLADALRGLRVFIVKAGTGGAMFRSLHAEFLGDCARLLADDGLAAAGEAYDALSAEWVALAEAVSAEGADPSDAHAAGASHVSRIAELENAGLEAMEGWLAARDG